MSSGQNGGIVVAFLFHFLLGFLLNAEHCGTEKKICFSFDKRKLLLFFLAVFTLHVSFFRAIHTRKVFILLFCFCP